MNAGTIWPNRVWEQDENGLWYSREATAEDRGRRKEVEQRFLSRFAERSTWNQSGPG